MSDLNTVLPHYNPNPRLLSLFESYSLTCADLLSLDANDVSNRCTSPLSPAPDLLEVKRFLAGLTAAFAADTPCETALQVNSRETFLTTGDETIDRLLGGGVKAGGIMEFVGERFGQHLRSAIYKAAS